MGTLTDEHRSKVPFLIDWGGGYETIELANKCGWRAIASWGRDGWDLAGWPIAVVFWKEHDSSKCDPICTLAGSTGSDFCPTNRFFLAYYVEGDCSVYEYATDVARNAACDEIAFFHWKWHEESWVAGMRHHSELPDHMRGPFSWERMERENAKEAPDASTS